MTKDAFHLIGNLSLFRTRLGVRQLLSFNALTRHK
jgi:hypothetical protein